MKKVISEIPRKIMKNKKEIEKGLDVKISNRGKEIYIEGDPVGEFIAEKIVDALTIGFSLTESLELKMEDVDLEILNIKDYTKRKDLERVRSRIIGKDGRTLNTLSQLTKSNFAVHDNEVGIIGPSEWIDNAREAIIALIRGAKQANVYKAMEKRQVEPILDLGLK